VFTIIEGSPKGLKDAFRAGVSILSLPTTGLNPLVLVVFLRQKVNKYNYSTFFQADSTLGSSETQQPR
jgi:hypothetical protein